jgi:beta-glucosidase/6-phospho-beta-glucosidase/beta-galactosidase
LRGWETRATGAAFVQYVRAVVGILRDVRWWLTFNEPVATMILSSYMAGLWPPGFIGQGERVLRVYWNLIQAHVDAYDAIHAISADAMVGCSHWLAAARRAPQTIAQALFVGDNEAAKNQLVFFNNHYFLDAVVRGDDIFGAVGGNYMPDIYRKASVTRRSEWAGRLDFVAVQYYRSVFVYHDPATALACSSMGGRFRLDVLRDPGADDYLKERLYSDLGWTIEPQGLREILNDMSARYQLPILITENGIGEAQDRNRGPFILSHLQQVLAAIKDGVDVLGYVHWTIADNWEWTSGYLPQARFGLFTVDRDAAGRPRHITTGAIAFAAAIACSNAVGVQAGIDLLASLVQRFGSIDPEGTRHIRQGRQAAAIWDLRVDGGELLELLLVPLAQQGWLGLAYQPAAGRWRRLTGISWERTGPGTGKLTFSLPTDAGQQRQFTATTVAPGSGTTPQLTGTVTDPLGTRAWSGVRRAITGVYRGRGDPQAPTHLNMLQLESAGPWTMAAATRAQAWAVCENVEVDAGQATVRCVLPDGRRFTGTVSDRRLTATVDGAAPWTGTALPDDIPFA